MNLPVNAEMVRHKSNMNSMELHFAIGTCLPFLVSSFITFLITDRTSHMKSMQHMAGISIWMYWIVNFVWDYVTYCVITTIFCLPIAMLDVNGFGATAFFLTYAMILAFGIYALSFVYCLSLLFSNEALGYIATTAIFIGTGTYSYLVEDGLFRGDGENFSFYSRLLPQLCLLRAVRNIRFVGLEKYYCSKEAEYLDVSDSFICYLDDCNECCGRLLSLILETYLGFHF